MVCACNLVSFSSYDAVLFLIILLSFCKWGLHITAQYSRCGWTRYLYNCKITCGLLYTITDKAELLSCLWHGINCDVAVNLGYVAQQRWGVKCFGNAKVSKSDKTKTLSAVTNKSEDSNVPISTACFIEWFRELILEASKKLTEALKYSGKICKLWRLHRLC